MVSRLLSLFLVKYSTTFMGVSRILLQTLYERRDINYFIKLKETKKPISDIISYYCKLLVHKNYCILRIKCVYLGNTFPLREFLFILINLLRN